MYVAEDNVARSNFLSWARIISDSGCIGPLLFYCILGGDPSSVSAALLGKRKHTPLNNNNNNIVRVSLVQNCHLTALIELINGYECNSRNKHIKLELINPIFSLNRSGR